MNHALAALPSLAAIEAAARTVYREFPPTPQYRWALLSERLGAECWLKHENHTPVGAFKIRGGLAYFQQLKDAGALPSAVISATRGNHGQSIGWAARGGCWGHMVSIKACTLATPMAERMCAYSAGVGPVWRGMNSPETSSVARESAFFMG